MDSGNLVNEINLLKEKEIAKTINNRMNEFRDFNKSKKELFKELCFCILTANFNAERSIIIQRELGEDFLNLSLDALSIRLKELGHRFPNARAKYIVEARKHIPFLKKVVNELNEHEIREWLVKNVKGLGYKESSHFLRNIGFENVAIVDFHIVDLLNSSGLLKCKRPSCRSKYMVVEKALRDLAGKVSLTLAELDLYLWYIETGKVLK